MIYKHFLFLTIICIFFIISCNYRTKVTDQGIKSSHQTIKDIPKYLSDDKFVQSKRSFEEALSLDSLENGFTGVQFRIWYGYGLSDTVRLIILTDSIGKWHAKIIAFNIDSAYLVVNKTIATRVPKSGWKFFTRQFLKMKINQLPDHTYLPDYYISMDANNVTIEYADQSHYKIFSYPAPENNIKIPEVKKVVEMSQLFNNEFDLPML